MNDSFNFKVGDIVRIVEAGNPRYDEDFKIVARFGGNLYEIASKVAYIVEIPGWKLDKVS